MVGLKDVIRSVQETVSALEEGPEGANNIEDEVGATSEQYVSSLHSLYSASHRSSISSFRPIQDDGTSALSTLSRASTDLLSLMELYTDNEYDDPCPDTETLIFPTSDS